MVLIALSTLLLLRQPKAIDQDFESYTFGLSCSGRMYYLSIHHLSIFVSPFIYFLYNLYLAIFFYLLSISIFIYSSCYRYISIHSFVLSSINSFSLFHCNLPILIPILNSIPNLYIYMYIYILACEKFAGSNDVFSWGPSVGWYLMAISFLPSVLLVVLLFAKRTKFGYHRIN